MIKKCLNELLDKSLIYIAYPNDRSNDYFIKLSYDNKEVEDYWFEMTEKGTIKLLFCILLYPHQTSIFNNLQLLTDYRYLFFK
ncbi:hypothetical protein [Caloranaerobacter sp. DY30410]|uniref:hypothetical protein n=1 Tax=Caloranaerobacter sp. DY30410 TaxID=3238305 RepID=UPI003CFC0B64